MNETAGKKMLTIRQEGEIFQVEEDTCFYDLAKKWDEKTGFLALLVLFNNKPQELHHKIDEDGSLSFITLQDSVGVRAYRRSLSLMMMTAIDELYPGDLDYETSIHFVAGDGLYCTMADPSKRTDAFLKALEEKMHDLVRQALPLKKRNVKTSQARKIFADKGMEDKERLFRFRLTSRTNLYSIGTYEDYYYGYMVYDTSYLKWFELRAFDEGFVLRYPDMDPTQDPPYYIKPFKPRLKLFQTQKRSLEWGRNLNLRTVGDLNELIVHGDTKELILLQEAYHEKQIAEIAEEIVSVPDRKFVMIAGPSSSGKTTFSHRLSTQLAVYGLRPHPIAVDNYFVNREDTPKDENGNYNFECLEAIDVETFNKDMSALLAGEKVELPVFNFKTGKREYKGNFRQLKEKDILVIEGIHCLNDKLSFSLPAKSKYRIYISALTQINLDEHNRIATTDGRLIRRIVRDARTRGTSAAATIAMWGSVRYGEENYIFPFQESADVMFNSALLYELSVLKTYAQPLLFGIAPDDRANIEAMRLLKFLDYFMPISQENIPNNSLLREFVGGSCFDV